MWFFVGITQITMSHPSWLTWAILSAIFAALTTILAKLGLKTINADYGLMVRTTAALVAMVVLVWMTGKCVPLERVTVKAWIFLVFSGLVTGAAW
jgi:bacterial/archaeal transporter family protein